MVATAAGVEWGAWARHYPSLAGIRFKPHLCLPQPKGRFRVHKAMDTNVAVWRMVPGFDDEYIVNSIRYARGLRAIVLELYGSGNLSARKGGLLECLQAAIAKVRLCLACAQLPPCTRVTAAARCALCVVCHAGHHHRGSDTVPAWLRRSLSLCAGQEAAGHR